MRVDSTLRDRYKTILSLSGGIFVIVGLLMLVPLLAGIGNPTGWLETAGFLMPSFVLLGLGAFLSLYFRRKNPPPMTSQDGGVIVLLCWVVVCLVSAWPFLGLQGIDFTHAVFEAVSGWTTTGLSVIDPGAASPMILLWRSLMQLAGGAGFAIIMLSLMPGPAGTGLSEAEGRGEQVAPHVRKSARLVLEIYAGYAVIGVAAYALCGMSLYDAINHAFAAISTGGFSTKFESIGFWDSPGVEAVSIFLMVLGSTSFLTIYLFLRGRWRAGLRSGELRLAGLLSAAGTVSFFALVTAGSYGSLGKSFRIALFETVSALTTTGFTTTSYASWRGFGMLALLGLMVVGGGAYSTAGGLKQARIFLLGKSLVWEIRRLLLPRSAVVQNYVWRGEEKEYISASQIAQVSSLVLLYLLTLFIGSLVIAAHGFSLEEAVFEMTSALSTVGLSAGVTDASTPPAVLWTEIAGMFLGRLEFLIVFATAFKTIRDLPGLAKKP
ncbi:MAG TPA: TrkH family potassium uptake protein [Candidatus Aminicenantes bacterium]|nr:TrkH family potassium uptake protein [Candidatus Aminicenantes bacterium]